jgi:hypothetical protein
LKGHQLPSPVVDELHNFSNGHAPECQNHAVGSILLALAHTAGFRKYCHCFPIMCHPFSTYDWDCGILKCDIRGGYRIYIYKEYATLT